MSDEDKSREVREQTNDWLASNSDESLEKIYGVSKWNTVRQCALHYRKVLLKKANIVLFYFDLILI